MKRSDLKNNYSNSREKEYTRQEILFGIVKKYAKNKIKILEFVDSSQENIKRYKLLNRNITIIGITLGDQKPINPLININEINCINFIKNNQFDIYNLDFYGPGRYFNYNLDSNYLKIVEKLFKFQNKNSFDIILTLDSFDSGIKDKDRIKLFGKNRQLSDILSKRYMNDLGKYVIKKNKCRDYLIYIELSMIISLISFISEKYKYYCKIYKFPVCYIGKSSGHLSIMYTIGLEFSKNKQTNMSLINNIKKTKFLVN